MTRRAVEIIIKENIQYLTRQQVRTFKGQLNSGNIEGAYKGLNKVLRRMKCSNK